MTKRILLALVLLCSCLSLNAQEKTDDPYKQRVDEILRLSNSEGTFELIIPQLFSTFRQQMPNVPAEFWSGMEKKFIEQGREEIAKIYLPLYRKYFTLEDLDGLIAFYNSPIGKKLSSVTPQITQEANTAAQAWGMQVVQEVLGDLKQQGYM